MSLLALRVSKVDSQSGYNGNVKKARRIKGLWTVKIEQQQNVDEDYYYVWLYEGNQYLQKLYALVALVLVFAIVMFPLWPLRMRQGVWYISMALLGFVGLFFAMSIVRLFLFGLSIFLTPPGIWLFPNLFEDVGFFDSFRPIWGWHKVC